MKTKNLLHFQTQTNTAILHSVENLLTKLSQAINFSTPQLVILKISRAKRSLYLFAVILAMMSGFTLQGFSASNNWQGPAGGDWNTVSNWSLHVPIATDVVVIPAGSIVIITTTAQCNSLTINTGATVTNNSTLTIGTSLSGEGAFINGISAVLNIGGNASITTLTATADGNTVNYNGEGAQSVNGTTYANLTISTNGIKTLGGNTDVGDVLTVKAGTTLDLGTFSLGATTPPKNIILECGASTGSIITGTGTLSMGFNGQFVNMTVNNAGSGTGGATISCPLVYGAATGSIIFNVADDGTTATDLAVSGVISGDDNVNKEGAGTLELSGLNTFTSDIQIIDGIIKLGAPGSGTYSPLGTASGYTIIYGTLDLNGFTLVTNEQIRILGTGVSNGGALINSSTTPVDFGGQIQLYTSSCIGTTGDITLDNNYIIGMNPAFTLTKVGESKLILKTPSSGTISNISALNITAGTVELALANKISNTTPVILNGGAFSTGETTGFNETVNTLALTDNSIIHLGTGAHSLNFSASNGVSWTADKTLTISGWTGTRGSSGTSGKIYFGASAGTLTPVQLSQITFDGYPGTPVLLSTGELVPDVVTPVITVGSISDFGNQCLNTVSNIQSYTVTGTFLTGPIEITPPTGFEISDTGGESFESSNSISLVSSDGTGTISNIPIFVRFAPTVAQTYSGNITHTSTGATTKNVAVSGTGITVPATASSPNPVNGAVNVCYAGNGAVTSISWNAVSGATSYDVYFGAGSLPESPTLTDVGTNSCSTGTLSASTTYHWKVVPKNEYCEATGTPTEWTFTTNDLLCYCKPSSNSNSTYINAFSATGSGTSNISNSGTGYTSAGFADYSASQTVSQYANNHINWSLTFTSPGDLRPTGYSLWVDWNKNGFDSGDNVYITSSAVSPGTYTGSFTVPSGTAPGNYRMRVFIDAVNGSPNDPCNFAYYYFYGNVYLGEAEDYTLNVTEGSCTPPTPTFTASPTTPQCTGNEVTYTTQAGKTNYVWNIPGTQHTDYELVSGGTSSDNTMTLTWLTPGSKTITVNYTDVCQGETPARSTITVNQQPVADAGEGGDACGLSFSLNATPTVGTGTWTKESGTGNASFNANANDPDATVTVNEYGTYVFRWTEVNGPCSNYAEVTVTFYLEPTPTFTASPTSPQIAGDAVTYTTQAGKTNYIWNIQGIQHTDYELGSGGTSSDNTVTLTWLTAGSKTVTVNYTEECQGSTPASSTVTVVVYCKPSSNPPDAVSITYINNFIATGSGTSNISNSGTGYTVGGYADYSAGQSVSQYANNQINWSLTFVLQRPSGGFSIWVDWDKNGFDSDEKVYTTPSAQSPGTYTGSFMVPSGQAPGNYRMRALVDAYSDSPSDPCNFVLHQWYGNYYIGEAEDYTVTITEGSCTPPTPTFTASPVSPQCPLTQVTYTTQSGMNNYLWTFSGVENTDYIILSGGINSDNTVTLMWLTSGSKTVTVNYTENCEGVIPASSTITVNPAPTATISYDGSPYCRTGKASVTLAGPTGGIFERMSGLSINTVTGEINLATSAAGSYYVSYCFTGENGCTGMAITLVEIKALPSVSITGLTEIKAGETTTLSPTTGGTWISSNNNVAEVTSAGVVTGISAGTAIFTFTDATTGCSATTEIVTVNDCSNGSLAHTSGSANPTVCVNTAITPILYTIGGGATGAEVTGLPDGVTGKIIDNILTVSGTPEVAGTFPYTVTTTGTASPCTEATANGTISVIMVPVVNITGNNSPICYKENARFYLEGTPGAEVVYSFNGGATTKTTYLTGGIATVEVTEASDEVTLSLISIKMDTPGCNKALNNTSVVTVIPCPTVSISGPHTACGSALLTAETNASSPTYAWFTFKDEVWIPAGESSTLEVTQSDIYWLEVTDGSTGCPNFSDPFAVSFSPLPEVSITGNNSPICYKENARFYLEGTPGAEVVYSFNGGATTKTTYLTGGIATVEVTEASEDVTLSLISIIMVTPGCNKVLNNTSVVTVIPWPTVSISGPHTACGSALLTAETNASSPTYTWYTFKDELWIPAGESSTLEVTQSDIYWLEVTDGSTGCPNFSDAFEVTILDKTQPEIILVEAGPYGLCKGGESTLTVVGTLNSATEWKWYTGSCGGTLVGTGESITVSPTETTVYYVRGEGGCATPGDCQTVEVTVEDPPVSGTLAKTPDVDMVCEGTDVYALLIPGSGGNGTDELEYRTKTGSTWAAWAPYVDEDPIATTGKTAVEVRTRRMAAACNPSGYNTVSWAVEARPIAALIDKYPNAEAVCEGTTVWAYLSEGPNGEWSGGNGTDQTQYRTKTGETWSGWIPYSSGTTIPTTGKTTVEIQTRRLADVCTPSEYNTVSWAVESTPVAGTLTKDPNVNNVCEMEQVKANLTAGSGGNGVDQLEFRTKTGETWSGWVAYTSGTPISTTGKSSVEVRTQRMADVCEPSEYYIVSWEVEATIVPPIIYKYPNYETVCEGGVSARTNGSGSGIIRDIMQCRTQTGGSWSDWVPYTRDAVIYTIGKSGVEIRAKRLGTVCASDWVYASWTVVPQPVAGKIIKSPDLETICEGTGVSATFTAGSGGISCTDTYGYRYDGTRNWIEYTPGDILSTTGHSLVEIRTQRGGCQSDCNTDTHIVSWTIDDIIPPVVVTKNIKVQLNAAGVATIEPSDVDNGSYDNCGIASRALDITNFSCVDVGIPVTVELTVTDIKGNSASSNAIVAVEDITAPEITCPAGSPFTLECSAHNIYYTVSGTEFDAIAADACDIASLTYSCPTANITSGTSLAGINLSLGENIVTWKATDTHGNKSECMIIVKVEKRPVFLTYTGDLTEQYSDETSLSALLVDNDGNPINGKTIKFTIGSQSVSGVTAGNGIATATLILDQSPIPAYTVKAEFEGDNSCLPASDEDPFNITQENTFTTYTGQEFVGEQNPSVTTTPLILSASVIDADDGFRSDIRYARVQFYDVNTLAPLSDWLEPGLVTPGDLTQGVVTHVWNAPVPTSGYNTFTIGVQVGSQNPEDNGYYIGSDKAVVNVFRTDLYEFITGGGHIVPTDSKGTFASDPGRRVNFGFNIKWNKTLKNLQGSLNLIFRIGDKVYQIRTNAMSSLSINSVNPCSQQAVFTSKANLTDVTLPGLPIALKGSLNLQVTMTSNTSPGAVSTIGFTVYEGNTLLYSSSWPVNKTEELPVEGGNLVVHNGIKCVTNNEVEVILYSSKNPSFVGEEVIFKAVVTPKGSALVPAGTIQFKDDATLLGEVTMSNGMASLAVSNLAERTHSITALYVSANDFKNGTSNTVAQQVIGALFDLVSDNNPSKQGEKVKFTATVSASASADVPTGTVTFKRGYTEMGTITLSGGVAVYETDALPAGVHVITAGYSGDANYNPVTASLTQTVNSNSTVTLVSSKNPEQVNTKVTFTATVTVSGAPVTGAEVSFYRNGTFLKKLATDASGMASTDYVFASTGTYLIEARCDGQLASLSQVIKTKVKSAEIVAVADKIELKVYPNPFSDRLKFEFVSPEPVDSRIDLYDMTGRLVKTIFEQTIEGGTRYEAEFRPDAIISAIYFYRVTLGNAIYNGKVIFKKE